MYRHKSNEFFNNSQTIFLMRLSLNKRSGADPLPFWQRKTKQDGKPYHHHQALRPFLSSLGTGLGLRLDDPLNRLTDPVLT